MKYRVRDHFHVHLRQQAHGPGTELDLTDDEAARVAHQIELVELVASAAVEPDDGAKSKRRRG
jgi:hypothetical protein